VESAYRFESTSRAPGAARHVVARDLDAFPIELVDRICVVVSELVTNSVLHAEAVDRSAVEVHVHTAPRTLRIEVCNALHPFRFHPGPPTADADAGRGLVIVDGLADRWGIDEDLETCVWAEFDVPAALGS
jgi:anti-sigma regulatory factor (Ser/Thr protein kinase)